MQQHHAILQAVDNQRRARHEQLSALGYSQLVEGLNNVSVSPRRWNNGGAGHRQQPNHGGIAGSSNSNGEAGQNRNRQQYPKARGNGAYAQPKGKGKARENTHVAFGDYVAPNEDPEEEKRKKELRIKAFGEVYDSHEETLRNDLSQNYLNTGRRPQNMLQGCELEHRFEEYPKLHKLLTLHSDLVRQHACPATYLKADLQSFHLSELLPTKFDSILIDPPLEEYARDYPGRVSGDKPFWTWDELAALPIPQIASNPGFIWLWVGSGKADANGMSGLDKGRDLLAKWGYRRCEDIVWLKTNKRKPNLATEPPTNTILTHTKEHCLMGIRGTVRRSTDGHFVHCNIDTDVMVWEGDENDPLRKPPELYNLIEDFCLGTRRLELFGRAHNARPGWLTIGDSDIKIKPKTEDVGKALSSAGNPTSDLTASQAQVELYDKDNFDSYFLTELKKTGGNLVPTTEEVETLRPRSPGGVNKASTSLVPGMKSNPQGIGRHTNRAGTPSASQALEYERLQAQFQEQFVWQQQQQQLLEMERLRQEEMMQQQAFMMQQMAMMGMPPAMAGMQTGMNGFPAGFQQNQMMSPNGQMQWQMPMGMGTGMNNAMQGSQSPVQGQGQFQSFNNGQQEQYQQQNGMQQGQFNPAMNGMFQPYHGGFM